MTTLLAFALLGSAPTKNWATYTNARFGFSVDRPADLAPGPEPENGDGLVFTGHGLKVTSFGNNRINEPKDEFKFRVDEWKKSGKVTYKVMKKDFFVISGKQGDNDFYQRTIIAADKYATFILEYPASERGHMKSVIEHMGKSLKFD